MEQDDDEISLRSLESTISDFNDRQDLFVSVSVQGEVHDKWVLTTIPMSNNHISSRPVAQSLLRNSNNELSRIIELRKLSRSVRTPEKLKYNVLDGSALTKLNWMKLLNGYIRGSEKPMAFDESDFSLCLRYKAVSYAATKASLLSKFCADCSSILNSEKPTPILVEGLIINHREEIQDSKMSSNKEEKSSRRGFLFFGKRTTNLMRYASALDELVSVLERVETESIPLSHKIERSCSIGRAAPQKAYKQFPFRRFTSSMYPGNSHANYGNQYQRPSGPPPSRIYQPPAGAPPSRQYERPPAPPPNWGNQQTQTYQGTGGVSYQQPTQQPPMPNFNMQNQQINGTNNVQQFQYSSCTGRKKALLVGINYIGTSNALRGCINDVHNMFNFLTQTQGYKAEDIVMLTDDQRELVKVPTKANMIRAMQWLVKDARPGDSLFFHYSGHGGQEEDQDGDEEDGYDDCIYPVDFQQTGSLVDDVMHDIMVKSLPAGCRLTCIFDSCHSGTALDLPFCYRAQDGGIKEYNVWKESSGDALNLVTGYLTRNTGLMMNSVSNVFKRIKATSGSRAEQIKQAKMSPADVIMFSGCKDSQTSADANESGSFTGALSYAFIKVLRENPIQSYLTLLQNIRAVLAQKYTQKPQLSSSHQIDPNVRFIM
ncbi:hypothetical protein KL934_000950 [Ogataea polymorpha]|nr:hypothetical protein KL927_000949 [Ogataea polymorpha]KAG7938376.1 hypothetical protein KL934_000950 [Ogataea polymorpha]